MTAQQGPGHSFHRALQMGRAGRGGGWPCRIAVRASCGAVRFRF